MLSGKSGLCLATKIFLKKEKKTSKNKYANNIQKKNGEIKGLEILVFIIATAINAPRRYAPLSPKKILALGKLNIKKVNIAKIVKNKKYEWATSPLCVLIINKTVIIINEWILNNQLKPSIRFDPFIINKKHKLIKIIEKISIVSNRFKNSRPVLSM